MSDEASRSSPADAGPVQRPVRRLAPERVQLSRAKGWRMPPNTVRVSRPSKWGNRFRIGDTAERWGGPGIYALVKVTDAAKAVALFEEWWRLHLEQHPKPMLAALAELRGKNLACWCKMGQPCHADVLLRLANSETPNVAVTGSPR